MPRSGTLVLIVHNLDHSGANQVILNVVQGRAHNDSNVVLISACAGSFAKRFVEYGVSVRVGPWRTLIQNIRDPYAFICNTIMTADCVEELTRTTQVPVIWLVHEWWDCDEMIDKQLKMRNNSLNLATIKQAFTVATRVVFVCNAQKALYSPTAPSSVIYVGVPCPPPRLTCSGKLVDIYSSAGLSEVMLQAKPTSLEDVFTFLVLGIVCPRKNQLWAIELFKQFAGDRTDVNLTIVGARYTREYEKNYCELVEAAIEGDSRISLHPVTDTVADFYRLADCLLLTSLNEVTPMVICEAFSYGLPVLSTSIAGIKEMITDGVEGYLFEPGDNVKAISSMQKVVEDDALRHRMGKQALRCFWRSFELTLMVQRYRELLLDLAPPLILIDMDGTLVDYDSGFAKVWCNKYPIHREKSWHIEECVDSKEAMNEIEAITHKKEFFLNLPPMAGAIKALAEMEAAGLALMICSTPILSPFCAQEKIQWVSKHLGEHWVPRLVLTHTKNLIKGDILIDDKPFAHKKIKPDPTVINAEWRQVLFDAPYNRSNSEAPRLYRWRDWRSILCPLVGRAVDYKGRMFEAVSVPSSKPAILSLSSLSSLPEAVDVDVGYRKTLGVDCLDCQSDEHRSIFPSPSPSSVVPCDIDSFSDFSLSHASSLSDGISNGGYGGNGNGHREAENRNEGGISKEAMARARKGIGSLACLQSASDIFGMGNGKKTASVGKSDAHADKAPSDLASQPGDQVVINVPCMQETHNVASNMDDLSYSP